MSDKAYKNFMKVNLAGLAVLGAFASFSIFAPEKSTNAASTATSDVTVSVSPSISVGQSATNVAFTATTSADSSTSTATANMSVYVTTNDPSGYKLYINTTDTETGLTRTENGEVATEKVQALSGDSTLANFGSNYWGYSTDTGETKTYHAVPSSSVTNGSDNYIDYYGSSASDRETVVHFGAKVANTLPAGHYTNTVVFTAITTLP